MKLIAAAACVSALCAVGLKAQTTEQTSKSKISVKDGKEVTVTGCVEPMARSIIRTKTTFTNEAGE